MGYLAVYYGLANEQLFVDSSIGIRLSVDKTI